VGAPVLGPQSSILGEVLIIGLTAGEGTSQQELRTLADRTIRPRLLSVEGVAQVAVIGGEIREYQILLEPHRMGQWNISVEDVLAATEGMNLNAPGGVLYQWGNEYIVRGMLSSTDVERLGKALVRNVDGRPVLLEDIAGVEVGSHSPRLGVASLRGEPAVLLTVTKQPHKGTIELTEQLDRTLDALRPTLPADVEVNTDIFRQADFIDRSIDNIRKALIEGAVFVIFVLLLFLMNGRVSVISLAALPLSLLMSVIVLRLMGVTINTMSLGGMAIAIGSLVDDAIIDVENVLRRLRENHALPPGERTAPLTVVWEASREIRASIVSATLITIVAFVPLFFLDGMEGRMLRPLGAAFIVSLFCSLVVAVTLTPVMCSWMLSSDRVLDRNGREPALPAWLGRVYRPVLEWTLDHGRWVLGGAAGLMLLSAILFTGFGRSFLPGFNEGSLTINVSLMPGVSLEESDEMGRSVEKILLEIPEIKTVARKTGRAELDEHALGVNVSELEAPFELDGRSREEFLAHVRERLGVLRGVNVEIGQPISHRIDAMLSGTKANIAIKLFGDELGTLYSLGTRIEAAIDTLPGLADVNVEQQVERAELQIVPRREMLARYGVTLPRFGEAVTVALSGRAVSQVYDRGQAFDLTVKVDDRHRGTMNAIADLPVDSREGKLPLSYMADVVSTFGPNSISREGVQRKIVVSANVTDGDLGGAVEKIEEAVADGVDLPAGYWIEYGGQFESRRQASRRLMLASLAALLVIFLVMLREFRSASLAGVVMLGLPFALAGGAIAVWFGGGIVSIPAVIGFVSLLGIAVRNGILLVSNYGHLREGGMSLRQSVVRGSVERLTPIMMTSLTSALALIPLALGGGLPGNEIQSPMAKVILGGLVSSMLLNILVVPIVYMMINRKER
jgi:CzcA family heavy metal efflux pump